MTHDLVLITLNWLFKNLGRYIQGAKYRTIEDVKDAVKVWAISLRKEFRVLKSNSKEYEVRCADRDCMLTFLSAPICIPQAHGSCSFSLRVLPPRFINTWIDKEPKVFHLI